MTASQAGQPAPPAPCKYGPLSQNPNRASQLAGRARPSAPFCTAVSSTSHVRAGVRASRGSAGAVMSRVHTHAARGGARSPRPGGRPGGGALRDAGQRSVRSRGCGSRGVAGSGGAKRERSRLCGAFGGRGPRDREGGRSAQLGE